MGKGQSAVRAVKQKSIWKTGAVWIAAAAVAVLVLIPPFDLTCVR